MATIELTKENFSEYLEKEEMLVIDFWGANCAPCQIFTPTFEEVSEELTEAVFAKVNTEHSRNWRIISISAQFPP